MDSASESSDARSYALSGKIMLSAIVILFFVVVLMAFLHIYARWYLLRSRRRHIRRRNRRPSTVFFVDPFNGDTTASAATRGLDRSVIKALPIFTFAATQQDPVECAVCLSEFEDNESGRILPNCKHAFHVDCIDMWFHSHSTCPLCRSLVQPVTGGETSTVDIAITVSTGPGDDLGTNSGSPEDSDRAGTSSVVPPGDLRRKPAAIEIPGRNLSEFENDSSRSDSPATHSFRSPMSRMRSLKRILSRERRTVPSATVGSSMPSPSGCSSSLTESDIERGRE